MPETVQTDATQELFEAIAKGDREQVAALLGERPDLANAANGGGTSPLLMATYCRQAEIGELLLAAGAALDVHAAAARGEAEAVAALLAADPSQVAAHSGDGWPPLHLAAHFGHADVAALLLLHGASIHARATNSLDNTALHAALAGRHRDVAELLLANGADVNARQHGGYTALQAAAQHGDVGLCELLLDRGADPNQRTDAGQTALEMAEAQGHAEAVELLRRCGAGA